MADKIKYVLNPFTGQFDAVKDTNFNRIVTHQYNAAGNVLMMYDPIVSAYIEMDALIVTDDDGNVVTT